MPKVWKRPHSTIYGKNVEFGSSLYSDKIGEINGRKFNSELPWTVRNSGGGSGAGASSPGGLYSQGYLSNLLLVDPSAVCTGLSGDTSSGEKAAAYGSFADLLELTNPNRFSSKRRSGHGNNNNSMRSRLAEGKQRPNRRIDFYDQYLDLGADFNSNPTLEEAATLANDNFLNFNTQLGLYVPKSDAAGSGSSSSSRNSSSFSANPKDGSLEIRRHQLNKTDINTKSHVPFVQSTSPTSTQNTKLLPKHKCQLSSSPYGQSADGRKLSLGSINPHSYRPSLPNKTTTAHSSDGEEFEFHDRSSPFYTDR